MLNCSLLVILRNFKQFLKPFVTLKGSKNGTIRIPCSFLRLHHNVIKTGIRMISLSYSKISLEEIALKLQLDSPEDAEFIVAKVQLTCE